MNDRVRFEPVADFDRPGDRLRFADLSDFYPKPQNPSPRGDGKPAAPAATSSPTQSPHKSPALWTLVFIGAALAFLHHS